MKPTRKLQFENAAPVDGADKAVPRFVPLGEYVASPEGWAPARRAIRVGFGPGGAYVQRRLDWPLPWPSGVRHATAAADLDGRDQAAAADRAFRA